MSHEPPQIMPVKFTRGISSVRICIHYSQQKLEQNFKRTQRTKKPPTDKNKKQTKSPPIPPYPTLPCPASPPSNTSFVSTHSLMQQRRPLPIVPALSRSKRRRRRHNTSANKHHSHDSERKRPLQRHGPGEELANAQPSAQERRRETDVPVLEDGEEEASVDSDAPDGDVGEDATGEPAAVHHHCAVPEDEEEGEG